MWDTLSEVSAHQHGQQQLFQLTDLFFLFYFCSYKCKPKVTLWSTVPHFSHLSAYIAMVRNVTSREVQYNPVEDSRLTKNEVNCLYHWQPSHWDTSLNSTKCGTFVTRDSKTVGAAEANTLDDSSALCIQCVLDLPWMGDELIKERESQQLVGTTW